jgi:hypothetical protein
MVKIEVLEQGEQVGFFCSRKYELKILVNIISNNKKALVYKKNGKIILERGPKRIWLILSKLARLQRYTAQNDEFLKIKHLDGRIEHRLGPCSEVLNTLLYSEIKVNACYCLDANQAILVYKKPENAGKTGGEKPENEVKITHGPGIFMLQPNEWTHRFSWHAADDENKTRYLADKNQFEILNCAPSQLYYNVDEVRTSDDALIRIKLMIFYELKDIKKMVSIRKHEFIL